MGRRNAFDDEAHHRGTDIAVMLQLFS